MEQLLNIIEDTISSLSAFKAEAAKELQKVSEREVTVNLSLIEQDTRKKELDAREAEIKKIENIAELKVKTEKLVADSARMAKELLIAQGVFEELVVREKKDLSEQRNELARQKERNEIETKSLIKARTELEEDKKNYKQKLAGAIVNAADKI